MNALINRVAAFKKAASKSPVRVHIHGSSSRSSRIDKLMMGLMLLAGVAGMTATQISPEQQVAPSRAVTGVIQTAPEAGPITPEAQPPQEEGPTLKYVSVRFQGKDVLTLDEASRIALTKEAAAAHELHKHGLTWKDLYGVIHAETAWIARDGMGKNGVVSEGLAQLEPNTAKALNVADPNDPIQAIHASAALLKEGARWARSRIAGLQVSASEKQALLREGVSIYYNLSTKGRNTWNGTNTHEMPVETIRHIRNTRDGAIYASHIEKRIKRAEKAQQQHQPKPAATPAYMRASLTGGMGNNLPSATAGLTPDFIQQFKVSQMLVDKACPTPQNTSIANENASCMRMHQMDRSQSFGSVHRSAYLVGTKDNIPVYLVNDKQVNAAAMWSDKARATIISTGLVKAAMNHPQGVSAGVDALEFVVAHEAAHHELQEALADETDTATDLAIETAADSRAAENLLMNGATPEEVAEMSQKAFSLMTSHNPSRASFIEQRSGHLQSHLEGVMQARNERASTRLAMR